MTKAAIQELILSSIQELEQERQQFMQTLSRQKIISTLIVLGLLIGVPLVGYFYFEEELGKKDFQGMLFAFAPIYCLLAGVSIYSLIKVNKNKLQTLERTFVPKVKKQIYKKVFETWDKNMQYMPSSHLSPAVVKNSNLITMSNDYEGDDYGIGALEDGRIYEFSELKVRDKTVSTKTYLDTDANGDTIEVAYEEVTYEDIFKGLFFHWKHIGLPPTLQEPLTILPKEGTPPLPKPQKTPTTPENSQPKYYEGILDAGFSTPTPNPIPEPKKETPPLFGQLYELQSSQPNVQSLLPSNLCQFLVELKTQWKMTVSVSFKKDKAYMAVPYLHDFWLVKLDKSLLDKPRMDYLVWNFQLTFAILEGMAAATSSTYQA